MVGKKLEEAHQHKRLALPPCMPPALAALVWGCTHWDPQRRPAAAEVACRLSEIILQLRKAPAGAQEPPALLRG